MDKIVTLDNLQYFYEKLQNDKGVFIGTADEYEIANASGKIKIGSLVIILEPGETESDATIALLGTGILGKMILGNK